MTRADTASPRPRREWTPEDKLVAIQLALKDRRMDAAFEILRNLLAQNPPLGDKWKEAVKAAAELSDPWAAIETQRRYVEADPLDPARRKDLVPRLIGFGKLDEAQALAETLLEGGDDGAVTMQLAMIAFYEGQKDKACGLFRKALALNPDMFEAWRRLAALESFERDHRAVGEMQALEKRLQEAGRPMARSSVLLALGSVYEGSGEYDAAFRYFSDAQSLGAVGRPYSIAEEAGFTKHVMGVFTERFFTGLRHAGEGVRSNRPIFVIGMPRSGTTLMEQLLTHHSAVTDGGELEAMRLANYPLGHFDPDSLKRFVLTYGRSRAPGGAFGHLGTRYLALVEEQFGAQGRVVDKSLDLPFMTGTALAALPNASYIWMNRDPRDLAVSIFKTPFPNRHDWTWSWERIAHRLVHIEALRRHFSELFPYAIRQQSYERLVSAPDEETTLILKHCGLGYEPVHQDAHEAGRAVMTASSLQVRQPVSAKSVGGWKRYEAYMGPFFEAFEKAWPKEWGDPYADSAR